MANLGLNIPRPTGRPLRVLCLGAHSDDIEIGCGGTILKLLEQPGQVSVHWVVFSASQIRADEARASAGKFLAGAEDHAVEIGEHTDGFFPYEGAAIKQRFEQLKALEPDLIFTHYRDDLHQDHRLVGELTWNTFRDHFVLEYEIPKYDGDLGRPNFFVHLSETHCETKFQITHDAFASQRDKHWFTRDAFLALARLRGIESASPTRYAEAFYSRKGVVR